MVFETIHQLEKCDSRLEVNIAKASIPVVRPTGSAIVFVVLETAVEDCVRAKEWNESGLNA